MSKHHQRGDDTPLKILYVVCHECEGGKLLQRSVGARNELIPCPSCNGTGTYPPMREYAHGREDGEEASEDRIAALEQALDHLISLERMRKLAEGGDIEAAQEYELAVANAWEVAGRLAYGEKEPLR